MNLPEICIKRPVFASVLSLILILFGIVGYFKLSVSELPKIEFPIVTIMTKLAGASPEIIDATVTDPIEAEINTIEGVKHIKSVSFEGFSQITVEFDQKRKIDQAAQDCRDTLARIRGALPNDIDEPIVQKLDINAFPVMWLSVTSDHLPIVEVSHYAAKTLKERLQKVKGVGSVMPAGEKKYALKVWLDPNLLYAHQLTVSDVMHALKEKNIELPSGRIESAAREFSIKTNGEVRSLEALRELIITKKGSLPIRIADIGWVEEGIEDERSVARYTQKDTVGLGIIKQPSANTVEVAQAIKKEIKKINESGRQNIHIEVAFDSSEFIEKSIDEMKETLWSSTLLVVICIFIFLRNFRTTLIPAVAIPISIIATFAALYFLGFTLNNFTLLALVLAIGVVVDDAIVMLENIFRHIEEGKPKLEAALLGAKEMTVPIMAASLALIAVFIPIAFMQGQVGQFFFEFGVTVTIAVAISAFVSLTLTPMLSSRFLKHQATHSKIFNFFEKGYTFLESGYKYLLQATLKRKSLYLLGATGLFISSLLLVGKLGKEFAPDEDRGSFIITLQAPEGSTLSYTDTYLKEIETILRQDPHIEGFFAALALQGGDIPAVNKGMLFIRATKDPKRDSVQEIISRLRVKLQEVVGVDAYAMTFNPFSYGGQTKPFEYILSNPDYDELKLHVNSFVDALKNTPGFRDVDTDLEERRAQIILAIDREKISDLGISIQDISNTLNHLLTGRESTKFKKEGERYGVIVQMAKQFAQAPDSINSIYLRSSNGELVRLDSVASISEEIGPSTINRRERRKVVTVAANLEGITLQEAVQKADQLFASTLPKTFSHFVSGEAEEMIAAFLSFLISLVLAIVIIYLVLAAQFESFIYPVTIMVALPLSLIGAFGGLYVCGMTLNMYSAIGMIMLAGLVTKNAILLVDCTNQLKAKGMDIKEALCEAGRLRLRPILMTATSTILGIIPIAFSLGAGADSRRPLGVCVIGGMLSSTLLTLFIVPAFYLLLERLSQKLKLSR
jgi:multidrug efflux pump